MARGPLQPGPDDDVEAVFTNGRALVDIEAFCNGGTPTVAEIERSNLPDADESDGDDPDEGALND